MLHESCTNPLDNGTIQQQSGTRQNDYNGQKENTDEVYIK
jgi:hypothetical protein